MDECAQLLDHAKAICDRMRAVAETATEEEFLELRDACAALLKRARATGGLPPKEIANER